MTLRRRFIVFAACAATLGLVAFALLAAALWQAQRLTAVETSASAIAEEVTGLLVLTQDYMLHRVPRAERQWHARYDALASALAASPVGGPNEALRDEFDALPRLFSQLTASGRGEASPARDDFLVDRVLVEAHSLAERAYQVERQVTADRELGQRWLMGLAVALPAALALLIAAGGWLMSQRVLRPLRELHRSMDQMSRTGVPTAPSEAQDELGDLSRHLANMAHSLSEKHQALQASEALLRLVTDNIPALVGYWDKDLRNRFANPDYYRWFNLTPEQIHGRHLVDVLGTELYERSRPHIDAALAGRRQEFDRAVPQADGEMRDIHTIYMPDRRNGEVMGFFVLITDVTERVKAERVVHKALAERETLLKEVYHRVKNNLQVVRSLLTLQTRSVTEPAARAALHDTALRVQAMAIVHELLYRSDNLDQVPLRRYVQALVKHTASILRPADGRVSCTVDVADISVKVDAAVTLGLLLTELVSNAFKHGFAPGAVGRLLVRIYPEEGGVRICVQDDGKGMPAEAAAGVKPTMGLQLAHGLAGQLGGELRFTVDHGTTATLVVPSL